MLPCIERGGFVPHVALHLGLFYLGALLVALAKRRGILWSPNNFRNLWDVAWHVPNIVQCGPVGLVAFRAGARHVV